VKKKIASDIKLVFYSSRGNVSSGPINAGKFLTSSEAISLLRRTVLRGVREELS